MKYLILIVFSLYVTNIYSQDYLIDKDGSSYYHLGKEYKCKQLGEVYIDHEEIFNLHHDGLRNNKTAKYLAIGGGVTVGVGFLLLVNSGSVYGLVYGGITVLTGLALEPVALLFLIKAGAKTKKAREQFNFKMLEMHGYKSDLSLAIGSTKNGVGLIMQF